MTDNGSAGLVLRVRTIDLTAKNAISGRHRENLDACGTSATLDGSGFLTNGRRIAKVGRLTTNSECGADRPRPLRRVAESEFSIDDGHKPVYTRRCTDGLCSDPQSVHLHDDGGVKNEKSGYKRTGIEVVLPPQIEYVAQPAPNPCCDATAAILGAGIYHRDSGEKQ